LIGRALAAALVVLAGAPAAAAPRAPLASNDPALVAVVVGSNRSPSPALAGLRYADDDAVQNARTLRLLGARSTVLLTTPDQDTLDVFPDVDPAGPATREALAIAFDQAFAVLAAARAAGRPTRFYFFFAGHGDLADGRPFLQMEDGRLWRDDLALLLRRSPADENHLVIDACYASLFVGGRGPGSGERAAVAPGFSRAGGPAWPPRTGLLTARSSGGQTHEWTEFQAGIFSHEVRSGLLGGADANLDGQVTYRELGAFIKRANEAIVNRKYRPEVVTAAPGGDLEAVLLTLPDGPLGLTLELDTDAGHTYVESETGVRVADLHPAPGLRLRLRLPTDLGALFVRRADSVVEARLDRRQGRQLLSALESRPARARARGAAHEAFLQLFARPFGTSTVERYRPEPDMWDVAVHPAGERPGLRSQRWPGWLLLVGGGAAAVTGAGLGLSGHMLAAEARQGTGMDRQRLAPLIAARNEAAVAVGVTGLVAAGVGLAWLWWTARD
jgi:hypothetical protein